MGMHLLVGVLVSVSLGGCAGSRHRVFELVKDADKAYEQGYWPKAEQGYRAVIDKAPDDAYAWFRLGNVQLQQGRHTGAIEAYQAVLAREPAWTKAYYNLSTAYLLQAQSILEAGTQHASRQQQAVLDKRRVYLESVLYTPEKPAVVASTAVSAPANPAPPAVASTRLPDTPSPRLHYQGWNHSRFRQTPPSYMPPPAAFPETAR